MENTFCAMVCFLRDYTDTIALIMSSVAAIASSIIAILAFRFSRKTYKATSKETCIVRTMEALQDIRMLHSSIDKDSVIFEKMEYLQAMEFFATGVNAGVYDLETVNKMSGGRLTSQYDNWMHNLVLERQNCSQKSAYIEYEEMITKLKKMRKTNE